MKGNKINDNSLDNVTGGVLTMPGGIKLSYADGVYTASDGKGPAETMNEKEFGEFINDALKGGPQEFKDAVLSAITDGTRSTSLSSIAAGYGVDISKMKF